MDLNQVTIYTKLPLETTEFFEQLGLRKIVDSLPRYARLECPDGESTLSVHEAEAHAASGITLYFECEDLDADVERLKALGVVFTQDPVDQAWLWREAYTTDPNGNSICLFHAGDNRKNPPWRLGSSIRHTMNGS